MMVTRRRATVEAYIKYIQQNEKNADPGADISTAAYIIYCHGTTSRQMEIECKFSYNILSVINTVIQNVTLYYGTFLLSINSFIIEFV